MAKRIKASELDKEIQSMLSTYVTDVSTGLEELKKKGYSLKEIGKLAAPLSEAELDEIIHDNLRLPL